MSRQVYRGVTIEHVGLSWYVGQRWFGSRAAARKYIAGGGS
ncbi:MAG TPA: hypothetical protein VFN70_18320 [Burkholderiales bacterium]|nr:hypothetical protein [Burkholderiales bacterium]